MIRRITILAAIVAGLALTGCSGNVKIGAVISETGIADNYGRQVKQGLDLALEEINASGGVQGRTVELLYRDDHSDADVGKSVVEELIGEQGVHAIIGAVTSPVTVAIAPICEQKRTVLLSPSASAPEITEAGNYIFRNCPSDILEGTSMADFARDLGLSKVVIFAVDNAWGRGLVDVFTQKYQNKFRVVARVFYFREDAPDALDAMVKEAVGLDPEGVYMVGYRESVARILKGLQAAGSDAIRMSCGALTDSIITLAGTSAEHLVYPQPSRFDVDSSDPEVSTFVSAFRAKYGEDPTIWSAYGYDSLKMMARAMAETGMASGDDIRAGLASIKSYNGASGAGGFDSNGDVMQYPRLYIVNQGVAMPYEKFLEEGHSLARPEGS